MHYSVSQLARLANVSVRTLHYYDEIGLLKPAFVKKNGYRYYTEEEFLRLQQIIFFKELDFELGRIKDIFDSPHFDQTEVLEDQKNLLELKRKKLDRLIKLINKTIKNMNSESKDKITDEDLAQCFDDGKYEEYKKEAREKWGKDMVQKSENIVKGWSKEKMEEIKKEGDEINKALVANMDKGIESAEVQEIVQRHFNHIIQFYDPSWPLLKIYSGLGKMYVEDGRFAANYNKYHPDLAQFLCDAIQIFCERKEEESA